MYFPAGSDFLDALESLLLDVLEVVFLSRLFLKALLETRNDVLARSVRDACADERADERAGERAGERELSRGKNARTVVAILGAAHLNGVQARLLSGGAGDALEAWEK